MPTSADASVRSELLAEIRDTPLPEQFRSFADRYEALVSTRNRFIWKWLYRAIPTVRLSSVADEHVPRLRRQKLRAAICTTLVDDFADRNYDPELLRAVTTLASTDAVVVGDVSEREREHLEFVSELWSDLVDELEDAPRYDEFRTIFRNDVLEAWQANEYGDLHRVDAETSYYEYSIRHEAPVMLLRPLATLDLMYSPSFDWSDFPAVRRATEVAQPIFRIGNWITTWERELAEGDYANGVVARALDEGVLTVEEVERLHDGSEGRIHEEVRDRIRRSNVERLLREDWSRRFEAAKRRDWCAESVDLRNYVESIATLFEYQRASRGAK